ncbi:MAG: DUF305 domain-containing protein [Bradyrhizobium sp.]
MSKYILTAALGAAIASAMTLGGVVCAQQGNIDGHMHHQMSPPMQMPSPGSAADDSFDAQMGRAMERMDRDMMVKPSGNYDRDFAAMMVPHHQGAVDMARIELQFGKDPVLRRLAQAIIVEQLQEIQVMNLELRRLPNAAPAPASNQAHHDSNQAHHD